MDLPRDHPRRIELNDEVHARPPELLRSPARVSCLALLRDPSDREKELAQLQSLCAELGRDSPTPDENHLSADLGAFRLKWERHTEFSRYMFIVEGATPNPMGDPAIDRVPASFLAGLGGEIIAAGHAALLPAEGAGLGPDRLSREFFGGPVPVCSAIGEGAAIALTDFRVQPDRFSRFLIEDRSLTPAQAGRLVQRLFEIDIYKTLALLAFPVARSLGPFLARSEQELAAVTAGLANPEHDHESALLDRLTRLEAEIERSGAANAFRFGAAAAYYELVQRRIAELRERRIAGLQTFGEFIERRLAPAMNTCAAVATRQETLSARVARATQLLATRIAVTQAGQNQELLRSMNRRARLQLHLQQTVEGFSIAAVTYYIVGLIGYAAKGLNPLGVAVSPEVAMAISIPLVLVLTALGVRGIRRRVSTHSPD